MSRVVIHSGNLQVERLPNGRRKLLTDLRFDRVDYAGVVHDWLYVTGRVSRRLADEVWRIVAESGDHHANKVEAWISWLALRIGGWFAWRHYRGSD